MNPLKIPNQTEIDPTLNWTRLPRSIEFRDDVCSMCIIV